IGSPFSPRAPRGAGAPGPVLLRPLRGRLGERGFLVAHAGPTILAGRPKMAPHIFGIQMGTAPALTNRESQINIKAKANEGLDATGRGEAIAAQAVALIVG